MRVSDGIRAYELLVERLVERNDVYGLACAFVVVLVPFALAWLLLSAVNGGKYWPMAFPAIALPAWNIWARSRAQRPKSTR